MRKVLLVGGCSLLLIVGTLGAIAFASPTRAAGPEDFTLISVHAHFKQSDIGRSGVSAGDVLTFDADVMNADESELLGRQDGECIFTRVVGGEDRFEVCVLSFLLEGGGLTVEGTFDQREAVNTFTVTGGTGVYMGARGQVMADFSQGFEFAFDLIP
jgi:hypothetical protein